MWQISAKQLKRPLIKLGVVLSASAAVSAVGTNLLGGGAIGVVTHPYAMTAAINTSNTTVGLADSNLYGETQADIDRSLDEMQAMGVQNVRILIPWGLVEPIPGVYNWSTLDYIVNAAAQRNMGILGAITSTPVWAAEPGQPTFAGAPTSPEAYADFAGLVAQRYAGQISAYEVWNEPNVYSSWAPKPDPAAYTQLLQAAYPAIKAADPNATVIGGVLMSTVGDGGNYAYNPVTYLQDMYAYGAQGYFDALSFHPYHYTLPFSQGGPYGEASAINQMSLMHQVMTNYGDGDKLIWASEYGEPTAAGGTEAMQAAFIQDFLNTWSQIPYAGPSFIYTTRDVPGSDLPEDNFGVIRADWTWKPAATVIQQWTATHPQTAPDVQLLAAAISPIPATAMTPSADPPATTTTADPASATATADPAFTTTDPAFATADPAPLTLAATPSMTQSIASATTTDPVTSQGTAVTSASEGTSTLGTSPTLTRTETPEPSLATSSPDLTTSANSTRTPGSVTRSGPTGSMNTTGTTGPAGTASAPDSSSAKRPTHTGDSTSSAASSNTPKSSAGNNPGNSNKKGRPDSRKH